MWEIGEINYDKCILQSIKEQIENRGLMIQGKSKRHCFRKNCILSWYRKLEKEWCKDSFHREMFEQREKQDFMLQKRETGLYVTEWIINKLMFVNC